MRGVVAPVGCRGGGGGRSGRAGRGAGRAAAAGPAAGSFRRARTRGYFQVMASLLFAALYGLPPYAAPATFVWADGARAIAQVVWV